MTFIEHVQRKPLTVVILFIIAISLGVLGLLGLPIDLFPDFELGMMAVYTVYPQAGPEEVEEEITIPMEDELVNISGMSELQSVSSENISLMVLSFDAGVDMRDKKEEVRDKLELVKLNLPDDVDDPVIFEFDPDMMPIMSLTLSGERGLTDLHDTAEDIIIPELERIAGVAQVSLSGGEKQEVAVEVSRNRMDAYNLSLSMISANLAQQDLSLGAGQLTESGLDYYLRTSGKYESLEEIEEAVISRVRIGQNGESYEVKVRDVADVSLGNAEQDSYVEINGEPGIIIELMKTDTANVVDVSDRVGETIDELNNRLPADMDLIVLNDNSDMVNDILQEVLKSAGIGVVFAIFVLIIFLRRPAPTFIVGVSIPISILVTIMGLYLGGLTFNILTLGGLLLGVGMIVDSSIVIIENIDKYRSKGILPATAALIGTKEMISPITGGILTTICVFLPMFVLNKQMGVMGMIFKDMSLTVIMALSASWFVAVFLVPVLALKIWRQPARGKSSLSPEPHTQNIPLIEKGYRRIVGWSVRHKGWVISLTFLLLLGSVALVPKLGLEFMPPSEEDRVVLNAELPAGTTLDVTKELMGQLERVVLENVEGYETIISTAGSSSNALSGASSFSGTLEVVLPPLDQRKESPDEIKALFRSVFDIYPQAQFSFSDTSQTGQMSGAEADITVRMVGQDRELTQQAADDVLLLLGRKVEGLTEINSDTAESLPEMEIRIDRQKAYDLGLSVAGVATDLRAQISGLKATEYFNGDDSLDVKVRLREEDRNSEADLNSLFVLNSMGQKIPFSSFATVERTTGPISINRVDKARTITVTAQLLPGYETNFVQQEVDALLARELVLPEGVILEQGGEMEAIRDALKGMGLVLLVAVLLVFGVMVSQFESLKSPFIIILALPTMFIGVVGLYLLAGQSFSVPGMIGLIMLAGIVVNNGIILVDYINLLRNRGYSLYDACVQGGGSRLRPVLMTTLTTVLAMIPMAFFPGEGGEMMQPLGLTVVGGLSFNTVTTLVLVPALYAVINREKGKKHAAN